MIECCDFPKAKDGEVDNTLIDVASDCLRQKVTKY
jgi:hypothetical protein